MAVIEGIPGLQVTVDINGVAAQEYDIPVGNVDKQYDDDLQVVEARQLIRGDDSISVKAPPQIVKYIEVQPGATFAFQMKRTLDFNFIGKGVFFEAIVDGFTDMRGPISWAANNEPIWVGRRDHFISGGGQQDPQSHLFGFGTLQTNVEDLSPEELANQKEQAREWGVLLVKCHHVLQQRSPTIRRKLSERPAPPDLHETKVAEKALKGKALDSLSSFNSRPSIQRNGPKVRLQGRRKRPFAIFEFRYRTMSGLIKEGIVPRPKTPTPAETVRQMSDSEVRRLAEQLLEKERADAALKNDAVADHNPGIKREASPMSDYMFCLRYKAQRFVNGKFEVDLTDD